MSVRIINADVMDGLAQLADESVHCVVTSPPYWGLRDYGAPGQIGLEPTLVEHIATLVEVFREVRRVLRKDGTLWLNYGDAYAGGGGFSPGSPSNATSKSGQYGNQGALRAGGAPVGNGFKPKDLLMMPERLAIALQDDGWYVRSRIIWHKVNPMPESVTDRPTKSHEHIWLMSRSPKYFYDADAIKEEGAEPDRVRNDRIGGANGHTVRHSPGGMVGATQFRNARDVWTIATSPFPEAHFATFPPELAERCIKAGTSEKGCCAKCGAPWVRVTNVAYDNPGNRSTNGPRSIDNRDITAGFAQRLEKRTETIGWRSACTCNAKAVPCTVLDPFGGSGTTGLVADRLQRSAVLIELNPTYAAMATRRITNDCPLFMEAAE
jgi:DNA modification methylase